jgi:hypothetical protein
MALADHASFNSMPQLHSDSLQLVMVALPFVRSYYVWPPWVQTSVHVKLVGEGQMDVRQGEQPGSAKGLHSYDRVEIRISCAAWPTIATVSGILAYWLWLSEYFVGSAVFLALTLTAAICSIVVWLQLFGASRNRRNRFRR